MKKNISEILTCLGGWIHNYFQMDSMDKLQPIFQKI